MKLSVKDMKLTEKTVLLDQKEDAIELCLAASGSGVELPHLADCRERYLTFWLEGLEDHSLAMQFLVYGQEEKPVMTIRFGILPHSVTSICMDMEWLSGKVLFPESLPGGLKIVCHGRRIDREQVRRVELVSLPCFHDVKISLSKPELTDDCPEIASVIAKLPEGRYVDCFGQNKQKEWDGKIHSLEELKELLSRQAKEVEDGDYPFADWTSYGGWKGKRLGEGTGFFTKYKNEGRWWLADPEGYAFLSVGPDCVGTPMDCRVDGVEKWLDWLPDEQEKPYDEMFAKHRKGHDGTKTRRKAKLFSYIQANLYKAFGEDWYKIWKKMMTGQLKRYGMNTLGNWSDARLFDHAAIPYVTSLPEFPSTRERIFRDFPDVFSKEYQSEADRCAEALRARSEDPMMIGYFLRNEPGWAFVDNLVLADEVLYNPARTVCKEKLIAFLQDKYISIEELNKVWGCELAGFDDFYEPKKDVSCWSEAAGADMKEFSRKMLRAYVEIPVSACRKADPNHMILGMRWAWISDPDLVTGWENFDVFSINCYATDPAPAIQNIVDLGVDLPVMIGEFHFGALDAGPTATGLEGVLTQHDRGLAYRYYCERAVKHPNGVGCHYFQCYDQFILGRFDGENYNIGLFDICSRPYDAMLDQVKECSGRIYMVAAGEVEPAEHKGNSIPMIAY